MINLVNDLQIPAAPTSGQHTVPVRPLVQGPLVLVTVFHENKPAVQYEFFIPAAIYRHSAVKLFLQRLGQLAPGATIFKGAVGSWKGDEEDVNIYRLILGGEFDPANVRMGLHPIIADLMAELSAWKESEQDAFLFTEQLIQMDLSTIQKPKQATKGKKARRT